MNFGDIPFADIGLFEDILRNEADAVVREYRLYNFSYTVHTAVLRAVLLNKFIYAESFVHFTCRFFSFYVLCWSRFG